jgi:hypothetical protein
VFEFDWGEVGKRLVGAHAVVGVFPMPQLVIAIKLTQFSIKGHFVSRPESLSFLPVFCTPSTAHSQMGAPCQVHREFRPWPPSEIARHGNEGSYVAPRAPPLVECEKCEYSWPTTIGSSWS